MNSELFKKWQKIQKELYDVYLEAYLFNPKASPSKYKVITHQKNDKNQESVFNAFQIPELWSGKIDEAEILFIGSNPGFEPLENFPSYKIGKKGRKYIKGWDEEAAFSFFYNRFEGEHINKYFETKYKDGKTLRSVPFWIKTHVIAMFLLKRFDITPLKEYAITELVPFKSSAQDGIGQFVNSEHTKLSEILNSIINCAVNAHTFVVFGSYCRDSILGIKGKNNSKNKEPIIHIESWKEILQPLFLKAHSPVKIYERDGKQIIFLPHPSSREEPYTWRFFTDF